MASDPLKICDAAAVIRLVTTVVMPEEEATQIACMSKDSRAPGGIAAIQSSTGNGPVAGVLKSREELFDPAWFSH
jgi:hypothetical protein